MLFRSICIVLMWSGNIVGPLLVKSQTRAQHYPMLWLGLIIWYVVSSYAPASIPDFGNSYIICIAASTALYFVLSRANAKKTLLVQEGNEEDRARFAFQDLTDKQNPYFRYSL